MKLLRDFLTDVLGVLLILAAPLLGWLPGPGGIPLFFAGLSLLAINHDWAKRILTYLKKHGGRFAKEILPRIPVAKIMLTIVVGGLFILGAVMLATPNDAQQAIGFVYILVGLLLLSSYVIHHKQ